MESYNKRVEIRWSDLDPNFHVKHSVYYDFGAYIRMCFLTENGLSPQVLMQHNVGPILLREECQFKREIRFGDAVFIDMVLKQSTSSFGRWTFQHHIYKETDILAAIITVDGAWIDTHKRKLTIPAELIKPCFEALPKADAFSWSDIK